MCEVLGVSRSGYYAWKTRKPSARAQENEELEREIAEIYRKSRGTCGSPRVHQELNLGREKGERINHKRVEKIMRELGLQGRARARTKRSRSPENTAPVAANLLARDFVAEEPDQKWAADITYIWTSEGWLYLAVIIDLFARRVVCRTTLDAGLEATSSHAACGV